MPMNLESELQIAIGDRAQENAPVLDFARESFPEFLAEHVDDNGDLVMHFFYPVNGCTEQYWGEGMSDAIVHAVVEQFGEERATAICKATRVRDLGIDSWWLRCGGVMRSSWAPEEIVRSIYARMAARLRSTSRTV